MTFSDNTYPEFRNLTSALADENSALPELPLPVFQELCDFIYRCSGIYYTEKQRPFLAERLGVRLRALKLSDYSGYLRELSEGNREGELQNLLDAVTVCETRLFRDQMQLDAITDVVLPELIRGKHFDERQPLNILSAGCSSGEEPYTIALLVRNKFPHMVRTAALKILATDINQSALKIARAGVYRKIFLGQLPKSYLEKYFRDGGAEVYLSDEIKKMVYFLNLNLAHAEDMMTLGRFDIILCRNVLIYFNRESRKHAVELLYNMLNPGGYLFLGQSESLHGIGHKLKLVHFQKALGYFKN